MTQLFIILLLLLYTLARELLKLWRFEAQATLSKTTINAYI